MVQVRGVVECGGGLKLVLKDGSKVEIIIMVLRLKFMVGFDAG